MDIVGPITPLPEKKTLGGMAHGTSIYSIGIVKWRFHPGSTTLTIHAHCCHPPNTFDLLMVPQRLSSARVGTTDTFTIGDKCSTLSLDGKLSLQIPY